MYQGLNMYSKLIILLTCFNFVYSIDSDDQLVDYYEQLIKEQRVRSNAYQHPKDASEYRPKNLTPKDFGSFDFVVVGSGSTGSVVASRLSEVKGWSVLVLEAGKPGNNATEIPFMSVYMANSEYNWGFKSTPQSTCCLLTRGICPFPRGKALGGTSMLNDLIYSRGSKADYDKWGEINQGWSFDDVFPYFIRSERFKATGDTGYHGFYGNLMVEQHSPVSKRLDLFLKANEEKGYPIIDVNGKFEIGANRNHFTTRNGRRLDAATAFLKPARRRENLKILTESYVTKILLSDTNDKVTGVLFSHKNIQYIVKVNREVILSAGVVGSPHILMHSGIGPADHLQKLEIPVKKDLPVGKGMHDQSVFYMMLYTTPRAEPLITLREAVKQYLDGDGPLTISANAQGIGFYQLDSSNSTRPEFEVLFVPSIDFDGFGLIGSTIFGDLDRVLRDTLKSADLEKYIFQIPILLMHPKTRGRIYLRSKDPYEYPAIESRCLADPNNEDIQKIYEAIQIISNLMKAKAMRELQPALLPYPLCLMHPYLSKRYWICAIRQTAMNAFHAAGTCSMGPDPMKGAVVDNKLKVYGVSNLRVADTSIFPTTISGHMNAAAVMVGDRVVDFIKQDYL